MIEEWKTIENYPKYIISNLGRIKSFWFKNERILKPTKHPMGYMYIVLYGNKKEKGKRFPVHRLVLMNFKHIENYLNLQCNHINGIKDDNKLENLEWCTAKENVKHAIKIGLVDNKGENSPNYGKHLSQEIKKKISEKIKIIMSGENNSNYGRHPSQETRNKMSLSHRNKNKGDKHYNYGKHLSKETKEKLSKVNKGRFSGERSPNHKLSIKNIEEIKMLLDSKIYQKDIAKIYGVTQSIISRIKLGKTWKHVSIKEGDSNS